MKIVVTGGSGYVGTRLIEILSREHQIFNLDIKPSQTTAEFVRCDISKYGELMKVFRRRIGDADAVIHLAAFSREAESVERPMEYYRTNVEGTMNLLETCRHFDIKRFVFASSYLVYGNASKSPVCEDEPLRPLSMYAATKASGESLAQAYGRTYGFTAVALRKSTIFGGQDPQKRVISLFMERASRNEDIIVFGDKHLDFLYLDDSVMAYKSTLRCSSTECFNIGSGQGYSLLEIANRIVSRLGSNSKVVLKTPRAFEVVDYVPDVSKASTRLELHCTRTLSEYIDQECTGR